MEEVMSTGVGAGSFQLRGIGQIRRELKSTSVCFLFAILHLIPYLVNPRDWENCVESRPGCSFRLAKWLLMMTQNNVK